MNWEISRNLDMKKEKWLIEEDEHIEADEISLEEKNANESSDNTPQSIDMNKTKIKSFSKRKGE